MINNKNNYKNDKNFCDGVDEISSEGDGCKVDNIEIKEKFDEFGNILKSHDYRIKELEINFVKNNEKLTNLEESMNRVENILLNSNNSIISTLNQMIISKNENETKKEITKNTNKTNIIIQVVIGLTAIGGALVAIIK